MNDCLNQQSLNTSELAQEITEIPEIAEKRNGDCIVHEKVIKSSEYLYGVSGSIFMGMLYEDVLELKYQLTKVMIDKLFEDHYMIRDSGRINDIIAAQKFNEKLIKELQE